MAERPLPKESLAANLALLLTLAPVDKKPIDWLAAKSGISKRMIQYLLKAERIATIDTVDALAKPFGLTSWQLIMPNLEADLIKDGTLQKLIDDYTHSSAEGRQYINRVAEQEAKYWTCK
jgi:transcriptional regulator with XRE-family HTH domain